MWGGSKSAFQKCSFGGNSVLQLVEYFIERQRKDQLELMAVVARGTSFRRNKWVFEGKFDHPNEVYNSALSSLEEFRTCVNPEVISREEERQAQVILPEVWKPPQAGLVKCNWDASLNIKERRIGLGIIVRDDEGAALGARCIAKNLRIDPSLAEAMAAFFAIQFCIELNEVFRGDHFRGRCKGNSEGNQLSPSLLI